ncbi:MULTISPECIES: hypothetical protein [Enterobacteriaceae]|uniref:hypothetical protein n=2 Tax=Enterobacteriaceae TaxID=543 RepID=UPI000AA4FDB6|nr:MULTISPECIES: hypothetical protein [Enterobacteriaceae]KAB0852623.1 hypothetical protein FZI13_20700 [Cronobacter sakazakii]HCB0021724.1 hypothetical protein [Klebsiella variicola subsp. variicola]MBG1746374.1 hypothetical protein [Klebsiella variicola]MBI0971701.1 hypothetical protein [Escherichia coli]MBK4953298.1 hypothetical protein [Klebsiella variicola]
MIKRITFNTDDNLTINSIDRYAESNGTSRSKVICELLRSTAPILDFVTYQNRITQEVESRLFSMFYHEVRHFETQQHKDDSTLKYLHLLSEKLVFRIRSEPIMSFSLPMFDEWDSYKKEFKAKIEENIEVHMPEDDGISKYVYLCIKKHPVEKFEFDLIQITIPFFIVDKYLFDIQSICYVRAIDFCNIGINEYMQRNKKYLHTAYLSWVPVAAFRDGVVFVAALHIDKALPNQLYPPKTTINLPYEYWKYLG